MNKVILIGRLTKEPEVKKTQSELSVCSFTLATDRKFKGQNGQKVTDFIPCVAWRNNADILGKYFHKGSKIGIVGNVQTRSYEDNSGNRVNVVEVIVDEIEFVESKKETEQTEVRPTPPIPGEVEQTEESVDLPFEILGY